MPRQKRIDDISQVLETIVKRFKDHEEQSRRLCEVASIWGGFEQWVRGEICLLFMGPPWNRQPWDGDDWGSIGVEYRADLATPTKGCSSKLVDLWISRERLSDATYYIELKTAFANHNRYKQRASWIADADLLSRMRTSSRKGVTQAPCGWASILFAVGWEDDGVWKDYVQLQLHEQVSGSSSACEVLCAGSGSSSTVRLAVLYGR